jgi:hypothetical protein
MQAKTKLAEAKNDGEREHLQNKCDALGSSIDDTVFDLYDLNREERDLIRNA